MLFFPFEQDTPLNKFAKNHPKINGNPDTDLCLSQHSPCTLFKTSETFFSSLIPGAWNIRLHIHPPHRDYIGGHRNR